MPRPRVSLRLCLLLVLLCAAVLGFVRIAFVEPFRQEGALAERIRALQGDVTCVPRSPAWFWPLYGELATQQINSIECYAAGDLTESDLAELGRLEQLEGLLLAGAPISDRFVGQLGELKRLKSLELRQCAITKPPPLEQMSQLVSLDLSQTKVASLDVSGLDRLEYLNLADTQITDDVVARLAPLPRLKTLDLSGSPRWRAVSDKGVLQISREKYPKLTRIYLYFTGVTEAGLRHLKAEFPQAGIYVRSSTGAVPPAAASR